MIQNVDEITVFFVWFDDFKINLSLIKSILIFFFKIATRSFNFCQIYFFKGGIIWIQCYLFLERRILLMVCSIWFFDHIGTLFLSKFKLRKKFRTFLKKCKNMFWTIVLWIWWVLAWIRGVLALLVNRAII